MKISKVEALNFDFPLFVNDFGDSADHNVSDISEVPRLEWKHCN